MYNSTRQLTAPKRKVKNVDPRKGNSLFAMYNTNVTNGNDKMWETAVQYLKDAKVLDFDLLVQSYVPVERKICLFSESSFLKENKKKSNYFSRIFQQTVHGIRLKYQNYYHPECGINKC